MSSAADSMPQPAGKLLLETALVAAALAVSALMLWFVTASAVVTMAYVGAICVLGAVVYGISRRAPAESLNVGGLARLVCNGRRDRTARGGHRDYRSGQPPDLCQYRIHEDFRPGTCSARAGSGRRRGRFANARCACRLARRVFAGRQDPSQRHELDSRGDAGRPGRRLSDLALHCPGRIRSADGHRRPDGGAGCGNPFQCGDRNRACRARRRDHHGRPWLRDACLGRSQCDARRAGLRRPADKRRSRQDIFRPRRPHGQSADTGPYTADRSTRRNWEPAIR